MSFCGNSVYFLIISSLLVVGCWMIVSLLWLFCVSAVILCQSLVILRLLMVVLLWFGRFVSLQSFCVFLVTFSLYVVVLW